MDIVYVLLIGLIAGWLAGMVMKGRGFGILGNIVVGVIGAFLGRFLINLLGFTSSGLLGALITAFIGAIVLLAIVGALKKA